jgi:hypothetical protein
MIVYSVLYSLLSRHRIVLLQERSGERFLPIWIGTYEAEAIALKLQGAAISRPLTHDLLAALIGELDGGLKYVVISDLTQNTFFARLAIEQQKSLRFVDSRPSDAIALAVRTDVPIFAQESVLEQAGITPSEPLALNLGPTGEGKGLDVFRDFVDSLDLDDLGDE